MGACGWAGQHGWANGLLCVEVVSKYDSRQAFTSIMVQLAADLWWDPDVSKKTENTKEVGTLNVWKGHFF